MPRIRAIIPLAAFVLLFNPLAAKAFARNEIATLTGFDGPIWYLAISDDGKHLCATKEGGKVYLWDTATWKRTALLWEMSATSVQVAFSPDGKTLALACRGEKVKSLDLEMRRLTTIWDNPRGLSNEVFLSLPAEISLASAGPKRSVLVWDNRKGVQTFALKGGHKYWVFSIAFSPDGKLLASQSGDRIVLWDVETRKKVCSFDPKPQFSTPCIAFSADSRLIAASSDTGVLVWDIAKRKTLFTLNDEGLVMTTAFSPDGKYLLTGGNSCATIWDIGTGKAIGSVKHSAWVMGIAFSRDGKQLVIGGGNIIDNSDPREIKIWDCEGLIRSIKRENNGTPKPCSSPTLT